MMEVGDSAWWLGILLGAVPLLALAVWHCNDALYRAAFALRCRGLSRRLPPGHMGLPFFGETGAMLWHFKVTRRPDGFIEARKKAYGEGAGMYRSHLFGHPTVVVCLPSVNRFVLQAHDSFWVRWPAKDLLGLSSMFNAEGSAHTRIRGYVVASFSQPRSLRNIARVAQPRVAAALRSWAEKGTIPAATEFRKLMFECTCDIFISMKPSPLTAKMDKWFAGILDSLRALPMDLPGTALNHGRKEENFTLSKGNNSNFISRDDISKLKYTAKVVEEAIRLANIAPMVHRVAYRDIEYGGYTIPQGWQVVVWLRSMHIDEKYYKDPLIFNPDRWDNPPKAVTNQVFGAGSRTCAGNRLARLQITIMLHHMSIGYKWEMLNQDARLTYIPQPTPVDGAPMAFRKLSTSTR